ncbi:MAG: GNAT family N-acetyltransferase [Maribacter sp.]|nr:GNAT family N-acetyltransferase [Maribacter sp.]
MLDVEVKKFPELSVDELYAILKLRSAIFGVEQNCVYQDLDDRDQRALHVLGKKENQIVAYTRIFKSGDYFEEASIGRVVVKIDQRKFGYGKQIMDASIRAILEKFNEKVIHLSAQAYLKKFYNELGFEQVGMPYLEDGIPHIGMVKRN